MNHVLKVLLLLLLAAPASPTQSAPTAAVYEPIVMLTEHNPWAMVVGSDSPSFVLYTNGMVIYLRGHVYFTATLSKYAVGGLLGQLDLQALEPLNDSYSMSDWTDQPTNVLFFRFAGKSKKISVYGTLRTSPPPPVVPSKLYDALETLLNYTAPAAREWKPDYIEVMVWPFDYAKGRPAIWPKEWPGLSDPITIKRTHVNSLFIPESQSKELSDFLASIEPKQAVLIDGRKWAISTRWPFPHEHQGNPSRRD